MARKTIRGITIEFGGDTTKLQTALKGVESRLKYTQSALKDVNRLLKLDPGNTQLLTQKQQLLGDAISDTKEKLKMLRDAEKQAEAELANGSDEQRAKYDALQREIIETEQQLKSLTREMKDFGSVTAQQMAAAGEKVKAVGEKITDVGTTMTKYVTAPIVAAGAASVAAFNEVDAGLDIIAKKTGAHGKELEDMQQRAKNLATSIPTDFKTAGEAVGEVNTRFGWTGETLEKLSGKFIKFAALNDTDVSSSIDAVQSALAAFNLDASNAGKMLDVLNAAGQETGADVNKLASDLAANGTALRAMGFSAASSAMFLARLEKNGVDSSTAIAGMRSALKNATKDGKSMSTAVAELQAKISKAKNSTQAMAIASELFGAKAGPALGAALYEGRLSLDDLNVSMDAYRNNVTDTFNETLDPLDEFRTTLNELKIAGMELVQAAAPMIKAVAEGLKNMIHGIREAWEGLSPSMQQTIIKLAGVAAAVGPVLTVGGKLISGIGSLMTLAPKLSGIINTLRVAFSGLWGVIAAHPFVAIGVAAAAALVTLYNKCEWFRNFVNGLWKGIKTTAVQAWEGIKNTVHNAIEKIKSFFNFKWELPKIKLPHFKIEGKFSLNPPSVPHLAVDWYRKAMDSGMILTNPTIFGMSGGRLLGGGEAGPEAVVGTGALSRIITEAVAQGQRGREYAVPLKSARPIQISFVIDGARRWVYNATQDEIQRVGIQLAD